MPIKLLFTSALALLIFAPPATAEPLRATPVVHEELARAQEELTRHFHNLSNRLREHFVQSGESERPLITIMLRHRDNLGLSLSQVQALEKLRSDFQTEATRRQQDIQNAEKDLSTMLGSDPVDLGRVEAKVREIEQLNADYRIARIRVIEQGKAQLSPEQREKLKTLLVERRSPRPSAGTFSHPTDRF